MKLIKPSFEILDQGPGLEGIYEAIETAGRLCYKSKRPEGKTAKDFVDNLIKRDHGAMLEHGTVYLKIPYSKNIKDWGGICAKYSKNPYSKVHYNNYVYGLTETACYITTNYRTLIENNWLDDLQYLCEPTEYHEKRITVHFITSIGIGRELLRHRLFSFANESTRYCNYSADKFNNEITFIEPYWYKAENSEKYDKIVSSKHWLSAEIPDDVNKAGAFNMQVKFAEETYLSLIELGATPQEAREVLPLATKSELIMTGFISDWEHLFQLRSSAATTGKPHPDMIALIDPLMQEFIKRNLITE